MEKNRINRVLMRVAFLGAVFFLASYGISALFRMGYPFELEWIEGGVLMHVERIQRGYKIYGAPSLEFVPLIYPPLYYYISAACAVVFGLDFFALRVVSFTASIACFLCIFLWVKKETGQNRIAFLAAGIFAATYRLGGAWLDLARVDSLYLGFLLFCIYLLRFGSSKKAIFASSSLFVLSFLTKQSALIAGIPLAACALLWHRKLGLVWILCSSSLVAATTLIFDQSHEGWFRYYIFQLPVAHSFHLAGIPEFWLRNLVLPLPVILIIVSLNIVLMFQNARGEKALGDLLVLGALLGSSFVTSLHSGSYDNVCLPGFAGLSILLGTALHQITKIGPATISKTRLAFALYLGVSIQFCLLVYNPKNGLPDSGDEHAGNAMIDLVKTFPKDVLIPRHGYLAWKSGKKPFAHEMAVADVLRGDPKNEGRKLREDIHRALRLGVFSAVIVDYSWLESELEARYRRDPEAFKHWKNALWPVTGMQTRPRYLYVLKNSASAHK